MTDNEIIKALEHCSIDNCTRCPYEKCDVDIDCKNMLMCDALDLIKRQQAEIERLNDEKENLRCVIDDLCKNTEYAKFEAVKEFVKRAKKQNTTKLTWFDEDFDDIAKEMVCEDAFIEGTELALDYGLPVPEEDLEKYNKIVDKSKNE